MDFTSWHHESLFYLEDYLKSETERLCNQEFLNSELAGEWVLRERLRERTQPDPMELAFAAQSHKGEATSLSSLLFHFLSFVVLEEKLSFILTTQVLSVQLQPSPSETGSH